MLANTILYLLPLLVWFGFCLYIQTHTFIEKMYVGMWFIPLVIIAYPFWLLAIYMVKKLFKRPNREGRVVW